MKHERFENGGVNRSRTGLGGFAVRRLTAWLSRLSEWQGLMDSNHRMTESESVALPLGEAPIWQELMESNHRPRIWSPLFSSLN